MPQNKSDVYRIVDSQTDNHDSHDNRNDGNEDHETINVSSIGHTVDGLLSDSENAKAAEPTNLIVLNINDRFDINRSVEEAKDAVAAIRFKTINTDNCLAERNPLVCLNVVELRVALAMRFLDFTDITDRL